MVNFSDDKERIWDTQGSDIFIANGVGQVGRNKKNKIFEKVKVEKYNTTPKNIHSILFQFSSWKQQKNLTDQNLWVLTFR